MRDVGLAHAGDMGFPGTVYINVMHTVTEGNEWVLLYEGTTEASTVLAMTNHIYLNLNANVGNTGWEDFRRRGGGKQRHQTTQALLAQLQNQFQIWKDGLQQWESVLGIGCWNCFACERAANRSGRRN